LRSWSYQRSETATQVSMLLMGATGFDRASSNGVDSTIGDDRKSSKNHNRKRRLFPSGRKRLTGGGGALLSNSHNRALRPIVFSFYQGIKFFGNHPVNKYRAVDPKHYLGYQFTLDSDYMLYPRHDSIYGLWAPAHDSFVVVWHDAEIIDRVRGYLASRIHTFLFDLTASNNHQPNLIDNTCCQNWTVDKQHNIDAVYQLIQPPHWCINLVERRVELPQNPLFSTLQQQAMVMLFYWDQWYSTRSALDRCAQDTRPLINILSALKENMATTLLDQLKHQHKQQKHLINSSMERMEHICLLCLDSQELKQRLEQETRSLCDQLT